MMARVGLRLDAYQHRRRLVELQDLIDQQLQKAVTTTADHLDRLDGAQESRLRAWRIGR